MAATLTNGHCQAEDKRVESDLLPLIGEARRRQPTVNRIDACDWLMPLVTRALDRSMTRKEAGVAMEMDKGQLSRVLANEGHLKVKQLGMLGERFWLTLADEVREHFGMLDRAELISQGEALIDRGRQLLAKAANR